MALDPILWAMKDAPVKDASERLVLLVLAEHADQDGCNAFPSAPTVAEYALVDTKTVRNKFKALKARGLIREGDQRYPALLQIPKHKRPVNWDLQVPYDWFSNIERINRDRAHLGRPALTSADRPPLGPAPKREGRKDKGQPRPQSRRKSAPDSDDAPEADPALTQGPLESDSTLESQSPLESDSPPESQSVTLESESADPSTEIPPNLPYDPPQGTTPSSGDVPLLDAGSARETAAPAGAASGKPTRGTRLPEDWTVTPVMVAWAQQECPDVDGRWHTEKFIDHFRAAPGQRGVKTDWDRTWKNWMRTEQEKVDARTKGRRGSGYDDTVWDRGGQAAGFPPGDDPDTVLGPAAG